MVVLKLERSPEAGNRWAVGEERQDLQKIGTPNTLKVDFYQMQFCFAQEGLKKKKKPCDLK